MERLERLRGVSDPLDEAVILLNYVVEVFALQACKTFPALRTQKS